MAPTTSRSRAGLALLGGPDAADLLAAALAPEGGEVVRWRTRQLAAQRGGVTASYSVTVRWPDGRTTDELVAAATGAATPSGVLVLEDGDDRVALWRPADDPDLPGLRGALRPAAVAGVLDRFGAGCGPVTLTVRAYRPRRRAVVEARSPGGRVFLKVVRPHEAEALHRRHRLLTAHGVPVPPSLGWTDDGLVVLGAIEGPTLRDAIRAGAAGRADAVGLPSGEAVLALLDRLPAALAEGEPRAGWLARLEAYAGSIAAYAPWLEDRVRPLAASIVAEAGRGPVVPTHGDLYEAQLVVDGDRITGLLDVDGAGAGERLDDLGNLLGHLAVLARVEPAHAATLHALVRRHLVSFERTVDAADLRYRTAAVIVALATGPHRVQQADWPAATETLIALAERWHAAARAVRRRAGREQP